MRCLIALFTVCGALPAATIPDSLAASLALHASFDTGLNADTARGDRGIYHAPDYKQQDSAQAGLGTVDAVIEKGAGIRSGSALRFRSKNTRALFFRGDRNVAPSKGTFSFRSEERRVGEECRSRLSAGDENEATDGLMYRKRAMQDTRGNKEE